ncbi:MAG: DUF1043 family protein [Cycloclasticus sp.]|nr:DUF1043 family protein [Cycloclasticus sp.]MBQ0789361.1 DUF1043 family protein [Cycloclasticus sp.]
MNMDLIIGLVIGLIGGGFLTLWFNKDRSSTNAKKIEELEAEREKYHKQVDDHFVNTAVLFKGLTDQYRDVYRHIASGAEQLCSEDAKALHIHLEENVLLTKEPESTVDPKEDEPQNKEAIDDKPIVKPKLKDDDEGFPLASEVEMSVDTAETIRNKANKNN